MTMKYWVINVSICNTALSQSITYSYIFSIFKFSKKDILAFEIAMLYRLGNSITISLITIYNQGRIENTYEKFLSI